MKINKTETVYSGRVFEVEKIDFTYDGVDLVREVIKHSGSVVIIPVFEDGTVALVRQFRVPARAEILEFAAGTVEEDEDLEAAALRELEEEIGVRAAKIEKISEFFPSPGFLEEKMNLYIASELTATSQNLDDDEFLSVERYSIDELQQMLSRGEIVDGKTIIGISWLILNKSTILNWSA